MADVISYASNHSDSTFNFDEIERTIKSGYQNNAHENGSVAKPAKPAKTIFEEDIYPFIPETVYDSLPQILKDACEAFTGRERDVFLTSALSVISGGLHNVFGYYSGEIVFPNVYGFIIAPPASGKGSMKYAKQLGDCYHDYLYNNSREAQKEFNKEKRLFDRRLRKAKTEGEVEQLIEPTAPKFNLFFIPADTSSAMLIRHLQDNNGLGCICETEADTLTNALKQDWGGYSDILRKGFHAEVISKSRITDLEYSEIKEPKFSLAITGTPSQMDSLLTSVKDGLFSRFLFYSFKSDLVWKPTYTPEITKSKKDLFADFSAKLCEKFKSNSSMKFNMTPLQGDELDRRFHEGLEYNKVRYSDEVGSTSFRLGLMCFKIAMVLTALRSDDQEITCSDEDFETAMCLIEKVYMPHGLIMLKTFDKGNKTLTTVEQNLLDWMPIDKQFRRAEISEESKRLEISDRSLSDILRKFIDLKYLVRIKNGVYTVTDKVTLAQEF
jgi:hypothetical protein